MKGAFSAAEAAILCIDDEGIVISALRSLLTQNLKAVKYIEVAQSASEAFEIIEDLENEGIELQVVVCDYIMPEVKGDELLVRIHRRYPKIKKIMLTGHSQVEGIAKAINEANLYRFIEKPWNNDDLILTLQGAISSYEQEKLLVIQNEKLCKLNRELEFKVKERTMELEEKNRELEKLSVSDELTRLFNRRKLDEVLEKELNRAERFGGPFGIMLIDIDHFKDVNDQYGHQVGDLTLVKFAEILNRYTRITDTPGRWGGEEFLIICPETDLHGTKHLAETIRRVIERFEFPFINHKTASFGVAVYQQNDSLHSLVNRADQALYTAKTEGRNRVVAG